jgi:N-acetyl-anhydromuramyl-L-alanine amidase AmpD
MPTKLGAHVLLSVPELVDYIQAGPAVIKLVGNWGMAKEVPQCILVIGRKCQDYNAEHQRDANQTPLEAARQFLVDQLPTCRSNPHITYWEGHNEPVWNTREDLAWYAQFEVERMRLMADEGLKCVIGNFSTGVPDLALWPAFFPALQAAKEHGAILGLHEYSCPWMWWMTGKYQLDPNADEGDEGWTTLRYRKVYRQHLIPNGLGDVLLAITECGIDPLVNPKPPNMGAGGTWKEMGSFWARHDNEPDEADYYFRQLVWYDKELQKDDYVVGAAVFTWGSFDRWSKFDVAGTPVAQKLIAHARTDPAKPFVDEPVDKSRGLPRVQYERTCVLLAPGADAAWAHAVVEATWNEKRYTIGSNADDAGIGDLDVRRVIAVNPQEWVGFQSLEDFYRQHYPGVEYRFITVATPDDLQQELTREGEVVMVRRIHCGINIDPANECGRPSVQELQDLGAAWVRFTFKDSGDGPQPTRFAFYDKVVQDLNQAGIHILMILSYETYLGKPACEANEATWNDYIAKFAERCCQIAQHYGSRVRAYQIWNEPDYEVPHGGYDPCVKAEVFGRLLRAAFKAIKEVSSATVVMGGLAAGQPAFLERVKTSTDGILYADAVGVHPYCRRPTPDWPRPDWGVGVLGNLIQDYRNVTSKPIWITEVGIEEACVQDEFPRRTFEALNEDLAEMAPYLFWFCWSDGMVPGFGLVDAVGGKKNSYNSFQQFALLPYAETTPGVIDRFSVHWSNRRGQQVRYIIVHSTVSPVGAPAENTLKYLVGPNECEVSAHELVLPGDRVYRLVPDERAAHHCKSASVRFPDGTSPHLAREITWGIEAYQVSGSPVGKEVLAATIERITAACRRFGLDSSHVLGHREIDPTHCQDPVGIDMDKLRAEIEKALLKSVFLAEAEAHQMIRFDPRAALQRRIFADGFVPNSPEFDVQINGVRYRVQRAEHLKTGKVRVYYAQVSDWSNVRFFERP